MSSLSAASAQGNDNERFVIKAYADNCIGNALEIDSSWRDLSAKSSSFNFGIDFGMSIWKYHRHSLEAVVGVGYDFTTVKANLPEMDYHYSAPATADMDNEPYIRYYELDGLHEKIKTGRITLPLYVTYRYHISNRFNVHALLGFKFGFNVTSKVSDIKGNAFSYGVYPQYDNLMIDATYMNGFGPSVLKSDEAIHDPKANKVTSAFLTGLGVEYRVWGPLALAATLKYEKAMTDMFKSATAEIISFNADDAPVTYTVAGGQNVTTLSDYFTLSKMSRFSYSLSLLFRF